MKKILILGAGIYQVPLIQKAKSLGYFVIVVSIPGNYPGFQYADKVYYEDTKNYKAILKIALYEKIDAILTTGTDVAMISVGKVSDELNLSGISYDAAIKCTNKYLMKKSFAASHVRTPKFRVVDIEDLHSLLNSFQYPLMIKVVDSSGSRGILKLSEKPGSLDFINMIKKSTKKEYVVVEEFVEGYEIGCEGFVINNEVKMILPHKKKVYHALADVPIGHILPFECSSDLYQDICYQMKQGIKSLGLNNCAVNADIIIHDNRAYIIELTGRCGATGIPEIVSSYYGIDYFEYMIKAAMGMTNDLVFNTPDSNKSIVSELIFSENEGVLSNFSLDKVKKYENVFVTMDYTIGDKVNKFQTGPDRIGMIIVSSKSLEESCQLIKKVKNDIEVKICKEDE